MLNPRALSALAVASVAVVFVAPLVLSRPEERFLNLAPLMLIATIPLVVIVCLPFVAIVVAIQRARFSRWPPNHALVLPFAIASVGTLPGMVGVHRNFLTWHSYLDHVPFSLAGLIVVVTFSMARVTAQPARFRAILCQALVAASVLNILFPWWPLD